MLYFSLQVNVSVVHKDNAGRAHSPEQELRNTGEWKEGIIEIELHREGNYDTMSSTVLYIFKLHTLGGREFVFLCGCSAFSCTAFQSNKPNWWLLTPWFSRSQQLTADTHALGYCMAEQFSNLFIRILKRKKKIIKQILSGKFKSPSHCRLFPCDFGPSFQNSYWIAIKLVQKYFLLHIFFALKWKDWGIKESQ